MTQDFLEYPKMVERAMRGVVREALSATQESGLPGLHHFYITFRTTDPDVTIAERLLAQYPDVIPYAAITAFVDPSVKFGLQFDASSADTTGAPSPTREAEAGPAGEFAPKSENESADLPTDDGQVVALENFRKK
jgi:hypothetical protein